MRIFRNRIVISLIAILATAYWWEFHVKPVSGPLYTEAVVLYQDQEYGRSLALLNRAYQIDPNDTAILTLMGWDHLKLGDPKSAEPFFRRASALSPRPIDPALGYAYTEITLNHHEVAERLLSALSAAGLDSVDFHIARAALARELGQNRKAAREFQIALSDDRSNSLAIKNLEEIFNVSGPVRHLLPSFPPLVEPASLTFTAKVEGDHFDLLSRGVWQPVYLRGVDLTPPLPGQYPIESAIDPALYTDWLTKISDLGANTLRVYTILPPAFYRALLDFNQAGGKPPLWLLQGIPFDDPPLGDMFNRDYYEACQQEIRDTIDLLHGRGDIGLDSSHSGGLYTADVSPWVAGFLIGTIWPSHIVIINNQLHADLKSYQGDFVEAPSGNATEIFLAQMIDYAESYEQAHYNWQHPAAFLNSPTFDPLRHPTENTILGEISLRRALGEVVETPPGPYDDEDAVSVDPAHLRAREKFQAGTFAAYSVFPFYPDFINRDPRYLAVRDSEGRDPFLGYLQDLKAHSPGIPLLITDYGIPTSLGIAYFSPAGFDQGGNTEEQQGRLLARLTRNIYNSGAAGGMVFEWVDEWFRQSWLTRKFEAPQDRKPLWTNFMDPAEYFGLLAADPGGGSVHRLSGEPSEWKNSPPLLSNPKALHPSADRFDPARQLKALYADADEAFLYLRLAVGRLDDDGDGRPDWKQANYLIGISTAPGKFGLTRLPFIAPLRFPMGMTFAIQLAGPEFSRIWVASAYNPFHLVPADGLPAQTILALKRGWNPTISAAGAFEYMIVEPNRRRFGREGQYFPPRRYDWGILRYGSLDSRSPYYDSLAEWHANLETSTIDLRIPWALLNVTDPSSHKIFAGTDASGNVRTTETPGFLIEAFSYRPVEALSLRPIMEQDNPITDSLPAAAAANYAHSLKLFRWAGWEQPHYLLRPKESYAILRDAFRSLPGAPLPTRRSLQVSAHISLPKKVSREARAESMPRR